MKVWRSIKLVFKLEWKVAWDTKYMLSSDSKSSLAFAMFSWLSGYKQVQVKYANCMTSRSVCVFLTQSSFLIHSPGKYSNSLSDSCFLFCEPALLGSLGVIPHTGPAGDFPEKKKKKKMPTEPWADRFASKKHQNSITGPEINRLSLLQFDLFTYFMSKTHKTKLQWNHNWIWLLIQLCVSGFSWTSSWTPVSSFSSSSVQYPVYSNQCKH